MITLFARLSLAFTFILLVLGLSVLWVSHKSSQEYFQEFTQQLNAPIAMYMAENGDFIDNGAINPLWLAELAPHVMTINPSIEVYLLDKSGSVVSNSPDNNLSRTNVNLQPIRAFIQPERILPIKGDDPRHATNQRIFSAFPLFADEHTTDDTDIVGYVYAVIAGEHYQSIFELIRSSYSFKTLVATLSGVMLLALLSGLMVFMTLTRRLKKLTAKVTLHALSQTGNASPFIDKPSSRTKLDEIDQLTHTYDSMAARLVQQYEELETNEANRREFIANISHDLRTPLTTMQSYLETLLLKDDKLSKAERNKYVDIAYRQSKHLRHLISQLFTLTKLESGEVNPSLEEFSLLELAHDTAQEFQIKAYSSGVNLSVIPKSNQGGEFDVQADIGMIHRVFVNLMENALRHTSKGDVLIQLDRRHPEYIDIAFIDSGCGMTPEQCKKIMRRHYTSTHNAAGISGPAGLGMAIVKNILTLHDASMKIESKPDKGTTIHFKLTASKSMTAPLKHTAAMLG